MRNTSQVMAASDNLGGPFVPSVVPPVVPPVLEEAGVSDFCHFKSLSKYTPTMTVRINNHTKIPI